MDYRKEADEILASAFWRRTRYEYPKALSQGEIGITVYLAFIKDKATAGELSKVLNLSSGRIAIALNGLEKKGYLKRVRSQEDGRKVIVEITEQGKKFAFENREKSVNNFVKILEFLGEEDAEALIRITRKLLASSEPLRATT